MKSYSAIRFCDGFSLAVLTADRVISFVNRNVEIGISVA